LVDFFNFNSKLFNIYETKLEISGVFAFTVFLAFCISLVYPENNTIKIYNVEYPVDYFPIDIPDEIKLIIVIVIILHLFGIYRYTNNKIKKSETPKIEDIVCSKHNCGGKMITSVLKCVKCGSTFKIK